MIALLVLLLLGGAGYLGSRWLSGAGGGGLGDGPGVIVGSPGGQAFDNPTLSPTPMPSETAAAPSESVPPPTVAATATPSPIAAAADPTATPPPPQPTAIVVAATEPDDAVAAFYAFVESQRFDEAYALWSARMKATYPRQSNLDDRFDETTDISFMELRVASRSTEAATVQANFRETYESGSARDFIGYWELVFVDGRWLLDAPTY
jgi:hypothetical protein